MVFRLGLILLPAVFGLNRAVAELSRGESAGQAYLIVDTIGNVIRGRGDCADGWAMPRKKTNWMDQSIASH